MVNRTGDSRCARLWPSHEHLQRGSNYRSEVFLVESSSLHGGLQKVADDSLILKWMQARRQRLSDMAICVPRGLHLQTSNIDDGRLSVSAGIVEWKLEDEW